ncbi:unnamed protein product [Alopecurus aequalis]
MYESPPTPTTAPPGRSDDALEVFHDILLAGKPTYSFHSGAALAPDRLSLCVLRKDDWGEPPQALQLSLELDTKESPLPEIEGADPYVPISADGHIWAMSATEHTRTFTVVTRRLGRKRWEQVGDPFTSPLIHNRIPYWGGWFLQGYAVLPRHNLILVSFQQYGLFLTFATDSGCWTSVGIDTRRSEEYLPIKGRAIYMEEHNAVYMLSENTIYAYQLIYCNDAKLLRLDPPTEISLAMRGRCPCDHLHAIVTTSTSATEEESTCCTPLTAGYTWCPLNITRSSAFYRSMRTRRRCNIKKSKRTAPSMATNHPRCLIVAGTGRKASY